ncbi:zinc finger miz domain-containing protein [Anaeramoeba flamelloides]|uniref:Zinc finger miz domain-containing protein n=1 Tax=Anaeramoeba flamelloides TaxID=1746091 RepID=A0ABQ8XVX7_9EUKA|nr:zinc finger miz domain-containing protein [Anaeramoeba flamelloides]
MNTKIELEKQKNDPNLFNKELSQRIEQIKDLKTQNFYKRLVHHYYFNKHVKAKAIDSILFGDSLFLKPEHPPLIGPGIVSTSKPLRFVLPQTRVKKILNHFAQHNSNFCIRFIHNTDFHKNPNLNSTNKQKNEPSQKQTHKENKNVGLIQAIINGSKFVIKTDRTIQVDLGLFDTDQNEITFQAINKLEETIVVFQHMKQPDLAYIANSISKKNTISKQNMIKQLKTIILSIKTKQVTIEYKKEMEKEKKKENQIENENANENENETEKKKEKENENQKEKQGLIISFKCPLSGKPISIPSRGRKCQHLQCFDLEEFLIHSEKRNGLVCPCCNQPISDTDLIVDGYLQDILKKNENKIIVSPKIKIFSDGKYEIIETPQTRNPSRIKNVKELEKEKIAFNVVQNEKVLEKNKNQNKSSTSLFVFKDIFSQRKRKGERLHSSKNSISFLESNSGKNRRTSFQSAPSKNDPHKSNICNYQFGRSKLSASFARNKRK